MEYCLWVTKTRAPNPISNTMNHFRPTQAKSQQNGSKIEEKKKETENV